MGQGLGRARGPGAEALEHAKTRLIALLGEGRRFSHESPRRAGIPGADLTFPTRKPAGILHQKPCHLESDGWKRCPILRLMIHENSCLLEVAGPLG